MPTNRWLTVIALVGVGASIISAGLLWLLVTRPAAVAMTLGLWLDN